MEELAKIGGISWYPGRQQGPLVRVVTDRYRDRARAVIATLDRLRATSEVPLAQDNVREEPQKPGTQASPEPSDGICSGATVIYRPADDRRAYPCRVVEIQGSRAYLEPILRACTGWVAIDHLRPFLEQASDRD